MPSRYVYKPASDYSYKDALAATGETELRRQAGQSQSLTNYYDSETYYNNQMRLFKPIIDEQKKAEEIAKTGNVQNVQMNQQLTNITDALENKESIIGDLLNLMKSREERHRIKEEAEESEALRRKKRKMQKH